MSEYDDDGLIAEATARIVDAGGDDDERRVEAALRPRRLSEFPDQLIDCLVAMTEAGITPRDIVTPSERIRKLNR